MATLVILRHGESVANRDNIFTGWSDVPLTAKGRGQAVAAGKLVAETGIQFAALHTSMLQRAIVTSDIVLEAIDQLYIPEYKSWRLNERHYGALRGKNKAAVQAEVGERQVKIWRRSFETVPPLLDHVTQDRRYDQFGPHIEPRGESLEMAYHRLMPYWEDQVAPRLTRSLPLWGTESRHGSLHWQRKMPAIFKTTMHQFPLPNRLLLN